MKITHSVHTGVLPDGRLPKGGAVEVKGRVAESVPEGGCGDEGCQCSPGHWISKVHPRTDDGVVFGYKVHFDSREALEAADLEQIEQAARKLLNLTSRKNDVACTGFYSYRDCGGGIVIAIY